MISQLTEMEGFDTSTMKTWKSRSHDSMQKRWFQVLDLLLWCLEKIIHNFLPNGDMKSGDESHKSESVKNSKINKTKFKQLRCQNHPTALRENPPPRLMPLNLHSTLLRSRVVRRRHPQHWDRHGPGGEGNYPPATDP